MVYQWESGIYFLCGYPLCDRPRPELQHKGKYHISLRDKKVYDLEERRLFCSNTCFTASNFYKSQLETSPLWLRDPEKSQFPTVSVYSSQAKNGSGSSVAGAEVEIGCRDKIWREKSEEELDNITQQGLPGSISQLREESEGKICQDNGNVIETLSSSPSGLPI